MCCQCVCVVCCVVFDVFVCVLCLQSEGVDGAGGAGGGDGRARHVHARAGGARDAPGPARAAPRCLSPRTRQNDSGKETRPRKPRHEKKTKVVRFLFFFLLSKIDCEQLSVTKIWSASWVLSSKSLLCKLRTRSISYR